MRQDQQSSRTGASASFEQVLGTDRLSRRTPRPPRPADEAKALGVVSRALVVEPESILQRLTEVALELCGADSAGISILENEANGPVFRWRAMAGEYACHLGGMTPRDFGPCGTTIDRMSPQLVLRPGRYFSYFNEVSPEIVEGLLIPFSLGGTPVGTLWVVAHDERRKFDAEDVRVMTALASFASAGYELVHALKRQNEERSRAPVSSPDRTLPVGVEEYSELPSGPSELATNLESLLHAVVEEKGRAGGALDSLSQREIQVMSMLVRGHSVKQISYSLGIDPRTVATHRTRLLQKLDLPGNFQLLRYALDNGLVGWDDVS